MVRDRDARPRNAVIGKLAVFVGLGHAALLYREVRKGNDTTPRAWSLPPHSCGSSNNSLKAMKTMTPMIAAKNMAGKETVDSSMLPACSLSAPLHNAIVCANRWFCWQRLDNYKAVDRACGCNI